jgi:two-component system chemotaxis response regulator CheY
MAELSLDISILLIDDSKFARTTLRNELKNIGFINFLEAGQAAEALEHLGSGGVGLIFCDQQMPGMTGTELLQKLRQDDAYKLTPFILITGHADADVIAECMDYGVDAVVVKPFSPATLEGKINQAFRERRQTIDGACEEVCTISQLKFDETGQKEKVVAMQVVAAPDNAKSLFQAGLKLEAKGDTKGAAQRYISTLKLDERYLKAHEALARIYEASANNQKALEHLQKAVELNPGNFQRRFNLAEIYLDLRREAEAIEVLRGMISDGLKFPDLLRRVAGIFLQRGLPGEAETALLLALSINPANPDIYKMMVEVYQKLEAQDKAIEAATNAVKAVPGKAELHWLLADALKAGGKPEQAKEQAGIVLKLDPDHAEAKKLAAGTE